MASPVGGTVGIRLEGLEELKRKLDPDRYQEALRAGLSGAAETVRDAIAEYPPASAANSPPGINGRWYERGFGTRTLSGVAYPTSEMLGRSWTIKVEPLRAIVGSKASYGPNVQDREAQASFHRARGWKTIQDVAEAKAKEIVQFVKAMIREAIEKG